jgi:hypothetical protein
LVVLNFFVGVLLSHKAIAQHTTKATQSFWKTRNGKQFIIYKVYWHKYFKMTEVSGMVASLLIAIIAIFNGIKWKEISNRKRIVVLLAIIGASLMFINQYKSYKKSKIIDRINATFGDITDTKNATVPIVVIGNSNVKFTSKNGVINLGPGIEFKVYIKKNKLFVNIVIHNSKGQSIAVIEENTWTIFENDYEYNNDAQAFELVTKGDRKVFFQIFLKEGVAHVNGMFSNK